jgi:hypothetical protein
MPRRSTMEAIFLGTTNYGDIQGAKEGHAYGVH